MSDFISEVKRHLGYRDLLRLLVARDHEVKYKNSFLGYVWSLLDPILMMMVLTVVFSTVFKSRISNYPVYLLSGRIIFGYITSSGGQGMRSIISNGPLLQKTFVPKYLFTLSKACSGFVDLLFECCALAIVMFVTGVEFTVNLLFAPLIFLQAFVFTFGMGLFLAQLAVFFRDTLYIYGVFTTAWMYLTPLFYPMENIPPDVAGFIRSYNPIYPYVYNFRLIVLEGSMPDLTMYGRGWMFAGIMLIIGIITFCLKKDEFVLYV